jgi:hypothetical protein
MSVNTEEQGVDHIARTIQQDLGAEQAHHVLTSWNDLLEFSWSGNANYTHDREKSIYTYPEYGYSQPALFTESEEAERHRLQERLREGVRIKLEELTQDRLKREREEYERKQKEIEEAQVKKDREHDMAELARLKAKYGDV